MLQVADSFIRGVRCVSELITDSRRLLEGAWEGTAPSRPVLLIHGYGVTSEYMGYYEQYLKEDGWQAINHSLGPIRQTIAGMARLFKERVEKARKRGGYDGVDVVGYSIGGLVLRYYLQRLGGHKVVRKAVTVCTPHQGGSTLSRWLHVVDRMGWLPLPKGACAARDLMPGSQFYRGINTVKWGVQRCREVDFHSIWSLTDPLIIPPTLASFSQATNHSFRCRGHLTMAFSYKAYCLIRSILGGECAQEEEDGLSTGR